MKKSIKIYGERNTNTNYLSKLIDINLDVVEIPGVVPPFVMKMQDILPTKELLRDIYFRLTFNRNLGWKHMRARPPEELNRYSSTHTGLKFITITKNPYSWLLSLHRRPYHQYYHKPLSFEEFLQHPWKPVSRENITGQLPNPVELWNIKNQSYLQFDSNNVINLTTEEIIDNPEAVIQKISEHFAIEKKQSNFVNYDQSTKDKNKDSAYYRDYYLSEKWREKLSGEAVAIINQSINKELMHHFGYSALT